MSDRPTADELRNVVHEAPNCGHTLEWHLDDSCDYDYRLTGEEPCRCHVGWADVLAAAWPAPVRTEADDLARAWDEGYEEIRECCGLCPRGSCPWDSGGKGPQNPYRADRIGGE